MLQGAPPQTHIRPPRNEKAEENGDTHHTQHYAPYLLRVVDPDSLTNLDEPEGKIRFRQLLDSPPAGPFNDLLHQSDILILCSIKRQTPGRPSRPCIGDRNTCEQYMRLNGVA